MHGYDASAGIGESNQDFGGFPVVKISFFSNYLNEHQLPLCLSLCRQNDVDFTFIALAKNGGNAGRSNMNEDFPFVLREYEGNNQKQAMIHVDQDDIVIFGHMCGKEEYVSRRMSHGSLSFRATERLLKRGLWWRFAPPKAMRMYKMFMKYKKKPMYVLCTSAYASYDLTLSGWPQEKCYKWGYFPEIDSPQAVIKRDSTCCSIVWASRFVQWKRPLEPLSLAKKLKESGYCFQLEMAGDGPMMPDVRKYVADNDLSDVVVIKGMLDSAKTRELMLNADIFLTTSSRKEGWGVTVNEAMASKCAVVASASIGSAPFLIKDGVNGFLYDDLSENDLYSKVAALLDNPALMQKMAIRAKATMGSEWSAAEAAKRLQNLGASLLAGKPISYLEGPCSPAVVYKDGWYAKKQNGGRNGN